MVQHPLEKGRGTFSRLPSHHDEIPLERIPENSPRTPLPLTASVNEIERTFLIGERHHLVSREPSEFTTNKAFPSMDDRQKKKRMASHFFSTSIGGLGGGGGGLASLINKIGKSGTGNHFLPFSFYSKRNLASLGSMEQLDKLEQGETDKKLFESVMDVTKQDFLIKLCRCLAFYGAPTHRLEYHILNVAEVLNIPCALFPFPGIILMSFGADGHDSSTHLIRTTTSYHMGKLSDTNRLCVDLSEGKIRLHDAMTLLDDIHNRKKEHGILGHSFFSSKYSCLWIYPAFGFCIGVVAFRTTWFEALLATCAAFIVSFFTILADKVPQFSFLVEFSSAFVTSALLRLLQWTLYVYDADDVVYGKGFCFNYLKAGLSGIAILLPGITLTTSVIEISYKNLASGTIRLFNAIFTAIMIGFGMSIGTSVISWNTMPLIPNAADIASHGCPTAPSFWWVAAIYIPMAVVNNLLFRASLRQWPIMALTGAVSYTVFTLYSTHSTSSTSAVATSMASFSVAIISNLYGRLTGDVAMAPTLTGIMFLVPGSLAVLSFISTATATEVDGTSFVGKMLTIALSITVGLFVGTLAISPIKQKTRFNSL